MMVKILIVDDEPDLELLIRQRFRKQIREGDYAFVFAHNGAEALEKLRDPGIDLILSDINMPVMDGLTLLSRLGDKSPLLKAVMVSAYGDLPNIRKAMNLGAFDFLTKPIDFQDFETTINKTLQHILVLKRASEDRDRLVALHRELSIAAEIQQSVLPSVFPAFPGRLDFDVFAQMIPAREVGGDFYDFFLVDDRSLGFVIADVSGKGVPAAFFMAMTRTLLRGIAMRGTDPGECLRHVNVHLARDNSAAMFVTLFYGILNTRTGEIRYSNGGHNPPYLLRRGGSIDALPHSESTVVGILEETEYETLTVTLEPDDTILLYTDGVTEAFDGGEQQFSEGRLVAVLQELHSVPPKELIGKVLESVRLFASGVPQSDDITTLALRYLGSAHGGAPS